MIFFSKTTAVNAIYGKFGKIWRNQQFSATNFADLSIQNAPECSMNDFLSIFGKKTKILHSRSEFSKS